jgi:hypothetical protein
VLLISKYVWYLQINSANDIISQTLHYDKATLEHIIPQSIEKERNWLRYFSEDFRKAFTYRLGNMTLLNLSLNAGAGNHDYSKKKEYYEKTKLAFTKDIIKNTITEDDIEKRHLKITKGILEDLGIKQT